MSAAQLSLYHDAELNGIDTSDSSGITLWFAMVGGQRSMLKLTGREFFRVSDDFGQNVVSRLLIFANECADDVYIAEIRQVPATESPLVRSLARRTTLPSAAMSAGGT